MKKVQRVFDEILSRARDITGRMPPPVDLEVDCSCRVKPRHFACVDTSALVAVIYVCEDLNKQKISTIRGVLAHELGHVYYDVYHVAADERDPELGADLAAETVLGWRIYYDPESLTQRAGPGARGLFPRPKNLW